MKKVVLLRHGESMRNRENRFTGWTDLPLSEKGIEDARNAEAVSFAKEDIPSISPIRQS